MLALSPATWDWLKAGSRFVVAIVVALLTATFTYYVATGTLSLQGSVLLLLLLAIAAANYYGTKDVLFPGFMISVVWATTAVVYVFCPIELNNLSWLTVFIFAGGITCFSVGAWFGLKMRSGASQRTSECAKRRVPTTGVLILLCYAMFTVPLFLNDTARIAGKPFSLSSEFFVAAREAIVESFLEEHVPYSSKIISSAPLVASLVCFVTLIDVRIKWIRATAVAVAFTMGLLTTGRVALLLLFSGWLLITLLGKERRSFEAIGRKLAYAGVAVIAVLTAVTLLTKAETQTQEGSQFVIASELTAAYIAGPITAFDYAVTHPALFENQQNNTFGELLGPVSRVTGISYQPPPMIEPWTFVPIPVNVYTAFKPFYVDFGIGGCFAAFTLFGFMHGVLFRAATRGSRAATFFLAGITYAIVFSPFTDAYHRVFHYIYLAAFSFLYFGILSRLPQVKFISSSSRVGRETLNW